MQKILVPVDFSKYSDSALKAAADIARKKDAELFVIHVIEVGEPIMGTGGISVDDENLLFFSQLAKKKLSEFLQKEYLDGIPITNIIELGPTYHSITRNIDKFGIDLIVMGSKGASGLEGFFIGSNTEKVVRNSDVPVLVIKNKLMNVHFKKIVFASDFDKEDLSSFKKAQQFANMFNADLKLMIVNTKRDDAEHEAKLSNDIQQFLKAAGAAFDPDDIMIYHDHKVKEGILNGAESIDADLIAIPTHGRKGLAHLFNGSIAEDVVNQSDTPVITFKIE